MVTKFTSAKIPNEMKVAVASGWPPAVAPSIAAAVVHAGISSGGISSEHRRTKGEDPVHFLNRMDTAAPRNPISIVVTGMNANGCE